MNTSNIDENVILEEASSWHCRLLADDVSDGDRSDFKFWISQNELHRESFENVERIAQHLNVLGNMNFDSPELLPIDFKETTQHVRKSLFSSLSKEKPTRSNNYWWHSLAAAVCLFSVIGYQNFNFNEPIQNTIPQQVSIENGVMYQTAKGETQVIMLADGSTALLNSNSMMTFYMDKNKRIVLQQQGEIYYDVEKDKERPFTVKAANSKITAVGTEFNIKYRKNHDLYVTVTEGIVKLSKDNSLREQEGNLLVEGNQAIVSEIGIHVIGINDRKLDEILAWQQNKLIFTGATLKEVVDEITNHTNHNIIIASKELEHKRLSGIFNIHDLNSIFQAIEVALDVEINQYDDIIVIVKS
jgi:transmembrane sensor